MKKNKDWLNWIVKPHAIVSEDKLSLEHITFNGLTFWAAIASLLSCIYNFISGEHLALKLFSIFSSVVLFIIYFYSRFRYIYNIWFTLFIILFFLSVAWFMNGGLIGSTGYLYIPGLIMAIIISTASQKKWIFLLFILNILLLYVIEFYFGELLVVPYPSQEAFKSDIIFVFLLVILSVFFLARLVKRSYDNERKKVLDQKKIIEQQNQEHLSSLVYASTLQKSMMPHEDQLKFLFKDYFVYFKPKDIVSGDFYWVKEKDEIGVVVVGDCTGHGVPAAFLSILGVSLLEDTFEQMSQEFTASEFLEKLRIKFLAQLRKNETINEKTRDGMDLGICIINYKESIVQFSGANRTMLMVRNNEYDPIDNNVSLYSEKESSGPHTLYSFGSTRNSIGFNYLEQSFINHTISFYPNDTLYLFSDGYGDQFDSTDKKKFKTSQLKKELLKIQNMTMYEQKSHLDNLHKTWKGDMSQTDDILITGLRI